MVNLNSVTTGSPISGGKVDSVLTSSVASLDGIVKAYVPSVTATSAPSKVTALVSKSSFKSITAVNLVPSSIELRSLTSLSPLLIVTFSTPSSVVTVSL